MSDPGPPADDRDDGDGRPVPVDALVLAALLSLLLVMAVVLTVRAR